MAAPELLPAPLLHLRLGATDEVSGAWRQAGQGALGTQGQCLHPAVRAGRPHTGPGDAGQCGRPHHRHRGQAAGPWRIVQYYEAQAVDQLDLAQVQAIGLDETTSKRGHHYVTVFIDMERKEEPLCYSSLPARARRH